MSIWISVVLLICCTKERGQSLLHLSFSEDYSHPSMMRLKSSVRSAIGEISIPDTNEFFLSIVKGERDTLYYDLYGKRPDPLTLSSGTYHIGVQSCRFLQPAFDTPQFGDEQLLVVEGGESIHLSFQCRQLNSGLGLSFSPAFQYKYKDALPLLSCGEGTLSYPFSEDRLAYFLPGPVELSLEEAGQRRLLATRELMPASILQLKLDATVAGMPEGDGMSIHIDTARNWYSEYLLVGEEGAPRDGKSAETALEVQELRSWIGAKKVWVKGYIVGGDITTSKISFSPPFTSATNLAMAARSDVQRREDCIAVELPDRKGIRDSLSLAAHPGHLKKMLWIRGDIVESYFKLTGLKNPGEFKLQR